MRHFKNIDWPISLSLLFACVLTAIAACVEPSGPLGASNVIEGKRVSSVEVTLAQSALAPGQSTQATAVAKSSDGQVVTGQFTFSSQDSSVAKVSSKGLVTALKPGVVLIQAALAGCVGTSPVSVKALVSQVAVVRVALDSTSLAIGHLAKATATAKDSAGNLITGDTVTWASLTPTVATVSSTGTVTAVAPGSATIQGTISGTTGLASLTVVQGSTSAVATVAVAIDSTTLLIGHVGHAVATARDALGNVIANPTVTWTSLAPAVATASSSGALTAVAEGSAVIRATVSGITGTDSLLVVVPPNLASQNLDGGSYSPYDNLFGSDVDVVNDPTNSGRGMVARMHYVHVNSADKNIFLQYTRDIGVGSTIYFRGEFYIDVDDLGADGGVGTPDFVARKILYYRPYQPLTKYGGAWQDFLVVVGVVGYHLSVGSSYRLQDGTVRIRDVNLITMSGKTWYTLELQVTMETSIGAGDGILRLWLDGVQLYSITDMHLSDPAWIGQPIPGGNSTPWDPADYFLKDLYVGEQVNLSGNVGTFDEYRYWDNVAFSTKRIGQ